MKKSAWGLLFLPVFMAGCAQNRPQTDPIRGIAASFVAARAFDRAQLAINRNDDAELQRAGQELRRAADSGSNSQLTDAFAAALTSQAGQLATEAAQVGKREKADLMAQSDEKYRAALAFAPQKAPEKTLDVVTLNALGYFLADRGKTVADFERAQTLTLSAYRQWPMKGGILSDARVGRALGPQDSYAWALFKGRKLALARAQEEEVLRLVRQLAPGQISAEIPFHMAEIYRSLREDEKARAEYGEALKLAPSHELKTQIEAGLRSLNFKQV